MATEVRLSKLGWTMEEGTIVKWYAQEGEAIQQGEPLLEVETDKVNIEVESPASGILRTIKVQADETVPVETVIAVITGPDEALAEPVVTPTQEAAMEQAGVDVTPAAHRTAAEGRADLADLRESEPGGVVRKQDIEAHLGQRAEPKARPRTLASPVARRLAQQHHIDLAVVQGTGPDGVVSERDVERYLMERVPAAPHGLRGQRIPLSRLRKTIGQRMQQSVQTAPHFTLTVEVDMTEAERRRKTLMTHVEEQAHINLTSTAFLVKATAMALHSHPTLNAVLDSDDIVVSDQINIGVAVALEEGLIVPVIGQADQKGLAEIAETLNGIATRAREHALGLEEVSGGTFTISNLGMFGIDQFSAIISPPQTGILAVGRIARKPVFVRDQVEGRLMMNVTLSADHRVVDGAIASAFLTDLKKLLEEPKLLEV